MKKFFKDIDELHQFTMELKYHQDSLHCEQCDKADQFVSHGYVYKKETHGGKRTVGKRIYCSNRFGHTGCGRTYRLYITEEIPMLQFNTTHLFIFLTHLFSHTSIQEAYHAATDTRDPRHAYRWLKKLGLKLMEYRQVVRHRFQIASTTIFRTKRLQLLLPTLKKIVTDFGVHPFAHYQLQQQTSFI